MFASIRMLRVQVHSLEDSPKGMQANPLTMRRQKQQLCQRGIAFKWPYSFPSKTREYNFPKPSANILIHFRRRYKPSYLDVLFSIVLLNHPNCQQKQTSIPCRNNVQLLRKNQKISYIGVSHSYTIINLRWIRFFNEIICYKNE